MSNSLSSRISNNLLYIDLVGRIDATNASETEADIRAIRAEHPGMYTVLDADELTYISSAGLRVIMRLRKEDANIAVINAASEVYQIFEMTGFTDIMKIEKAYRRLSVEGCAFIAKGANGAVYRYDPETVVKVYFNPDSLPEIERERKNSRAAFVLGVNTAIPYDIVRVGDGYGSVTELLNADPITKLIRRDPEHLDQAVAYFVDTVKHIHTIDAGSANLPKLKDNFLDWVAFVKPSLPEDQYEKLHALAEALPDPTTLLHGDYHPDNVMVQNGETLLIDMDTLATGHPILELASMYNALVGFSEVNPETCTNFFGFDREVGKRFWDLSLQRYLNTTDEKILNDVQQKAQIIGCTRLLRRTLRRNEPTREKVINHCLNRYAELLPRVDTLEF